MVIDCVDLTVFIVGHQDLTAEGPEARRDAPRARCRRYSWSFSAAAAVHDRDECDISQMGNWVFCNRPDGAVLARCDHFVTKCAHMVERKRTVGRDGEPERRKRRDDTSRELKDVSALCDENVARGAPGRRGLSWSDSQVFF